jgi:small subunit ribosomal protein S20
VKSLPNIKSAKKRVKVIDKKTAQNKMLKSALKTYMKKYELALATGDKAAATEAYKIAVKKIDQAVAKGLLHKNSAARKKSGYTVKLNQLGA